MPAASFTSPTAPTGRTGVGSGINNREDLDNELTILDAKSYPLTLLCKRGKRSKAMLTEWPVDQYADPKTDGVPEGQDATSFEDPFDQQSRLQNRNQRFFRTWMVTIEQENSDSAGKADKAMAKVKKLVEIKRDLEATLASDNDVTVPGPGVASSMRGLGKWISNTPGSDVPEIYRTPTTSIIGQAPTEITFNDLLRSIHLQNGEVNNLTAVLGATVRQRVAEFQRTDNNASEAVYRVNTNAADKTVTMAVNIYDSDFGFVRIVNANPKCQSQTRGYILNPNFIELSYFLPTGSKDLPDLGGGPRGIVDAVATLIMRDPRAHAKIAY